jgi:hypothetical protein
VSARDRKPVRIGALPGGGVGTRPAELPEKILDKKSCHKISCEKYMGFPAAPEEVDMHPTHPAMTATVARCRVAELRNLTASPSGAPHRPRRRAVLREGAGWFLIGVGLRLAVHPQPLRPATR